MEGFIIHPDANADTDILLDYGPAVPDDLSGKSNAKHEELLELFHVLQFEFVPDLFKQRPCVEKISQLMKKITHARTSHRNDEEATTIADDIARLTELLDAFIASSSQPIPWSLQNWEYASWVYGRCCGLRDALEFEGLTGCDAYRDTMNMCHTLRAYLDVNLNDVGKLEKAMKDINDLGTYFFTSHDQYFGKIFRGEIKT